MILASASFYDFPLSRLTADREKNGNSLSKSAPVPPYIPSLHQTLLFANGADLWARYALIIAVVPLADILGNLDAGFAVEACFRKLLAVDFPRQGIRNVEIEQFKGPLCSLSRRDVSGTRDDQLLENAYIGLPKPKVDRLK